MKHIVVFFAAVVLLTTGMQNWFAYNTVYWVDIHFPSTSIRVGGANPPGIDVANGTLLFSSSITEEIFITIELPHGAVAESDFRAHIQWSKTTSAANGVVWKLDYECADIGEIFTGSLGTTVTLSNIDAHSDTAHKHAADEVTIPGTGLGTSLDSVCMFRVYRDHDAGGDTYGADVRMYSFDFDFQVDQPGSVTSGLKYQ